MFKKRFIYEQEEEVELNDFQKILALNKRRIHPSEIEFETSDGKDFSDIIDINYDGIHFNFNGLSEFLKFFFPVEYGDNTEGEYEAANYEYMYEGRWDWYDEFYNRAYGDWDEGYIVGGFSSDSLKKLKRILDVTVPSTGRHIIETNGQYSIDNQEGVTAITSFLDRMGFEEPIMDAYYDARYASIHGVPKYIEDTYCDCLTDVGIEKYSERYCFWKYVMDWGSAILLFARFGTENDKFLDLLFEGIGKSHVRHLPEYYEIEHYAFDNDAFYDVYDKKLENVFDDLSEKIETEMYDTDYLEALDKISSIGGFGRWITSKNRKFKIRLVDIDAETLKITFVISNGSIYSDLLEKKGRTTIDEIIALLNNESLFGPEEFREHYLKFLQKTIL